MYRDTDEIIRGLELCAMGQLGCQMNCPYDDVHECEQNLLRDAAALLKAQKPRVLSLHEIHFLQRNDVVWLEDKDKHEIIPAIVRNRFVWPHSVMWVTDFLREDKCTISAADNDYNKRWRCWTSRPTDAQKEAIRWE